MTDQLAPALPHPRRRPRASPKLPSAMCGCTLVECWWGGRQATNASPPIRINRRHGAGTGSWRPKAMITGAWGAQATGRTEQRYRTLRQPYPVDARSADARGLDAGYLRPRHKRANLLGASAIAEPVSRRRQHQLRKAAAVELARAAIHRLGLGRRAPTPGADRTRPASTPHARATLTTRPSYRTIKPPRSPRPTPVAEQVREDRGNARANLAQQSAPTLTRYHRDPNITPRYYAEVTKATVPQARHTLCRGGALRESPRPLSVGQWHGLGKFDQQSGRNSE